MINLSQKYRWILVTSLVFNNPKAVPVTAGKYHIKEIEEHLSRLVKSNLSQYRYNNELKRMTLRDFKNVGEGCFCILIGVGDKDMPNTVYENFDTNKHREIKKEDGEGGAVTSHVLIKRTPLPNMSDQYVALIEKAPGINISSVGRYLRFLCKSCRTKTYTKNEKDVEYYPTCDLLGHKSRTLEDVLETGSLQDVEFVARHVQSAGLDEKEFIREDVSKAKFIIKRQYEKSELGSFFEKLMEKVRSRDFQKLFVRVKSDTGQIKRSEFTMESEEILCQQFVLNEKIDGFDLLQQAYSEISEPVVSKMAALMENY